MDWIQKGIKFWSVALYIGLELHFSWIRIFQNLIIFVKYASSSVKRDLCPHFQNLFRLEIAVLSPTSQPWVYHYNRTIETIISVQSFGYESRTQTYSLSHPKPCLVHVVMWMDGKIVNLSLRENIWCLTNYSVIQ